MSKKLTPWFAGDVKPAQPGVYRREVGLNTAAIDGYAHWSGDFWSPTRRTPEKAADVSHYPSGYQLRREETRWRGLAAKPKAAA